MSNLLNKKIPTIVGLLIITLGIFGTTYLVENLRPFFIRATEQISEEEIPQEVVVPELPKPEVPTPTIASPSSIPSGFKTTKPPAQTVNVPKIINPKENETFTDSQPRFSGTAPKGSTIKVIIESQEPVEITVQSDNLGNWFYRPTTPLAPGEHTITITAPDSSGILRTITRNFKVFAAGTQVGEPATPSATPTIKVAIAPTPTLKAIPTPTPTAIPTAIIPTKAPGPIPVTGDSLPLIFLGTIGVVTFLVGLALLF